MYPVRTIDNLSWFASHLQTLRTHPNSPKVNVSLYVTTASSKPTTSNESLSDSSTDGYHRRELNEKTSTESPPTSPVSQEVGPINSSAHDTEKTGLSRYPSSSHSSVYGVVKAGRPDTATLIREAVSSTPASGRVLVAACGPKGLMKTVRNTTASLIRGNGPGVELHCEEFGW